MIDHQTALIYVMVLASASDTDMTDAELRRIGHITSNLPIFRGYDSKVLMTAAEDCAGLLDDDDGLENAFDVIRKSLPGKLRETAYALACDVVAAGIERGARARFAIYQPEAKAAD